MKVVKWIRVLCHSLVVLSALAWFGACAERVERVDLADDEVATSSSEVSVARACTSNCGCTYGNVCRNGQCQPDFGPFPECYCSSRDCGPGQTCTGGTCQDPAPVTCWSNCDCTFGNKCSNGQCEPDFGPFPECYCSYRDCGTSQICRSGSCSDL